MGQFNPKVKDDRYEINPDQNNHKRAGGSINRAQVTVPDDDSNDKLSNDKQNGGEYSAKPAGPPFHAYIGKKTVDERKDGSNDGQRKDDVSDLGQEDKIGAEVGAQKIFEKTDRCVNNQRNQDDKAQA